MRHAIFNPATGEILRLLNCDAETAALNTAAGESALEVGEDVGDDTHYVVGDAPVPMPTSPGLHHDFNYTTKQWAPNPAAAWASVRQRRSRLLAGSDWVVTKATEAGQPVDPAWMTYRQALRDITLQADPWAIVWPVAQGAVKIEPGAAADPAPTET